MKLVKIKFFNYKNKKAIQTRKTSTKIKTEIIPRLMIITII